MTVQPAPASFVDDEPGGDIPRDHNGWPRIAPVGHTGRDIGVKLTPYRRASGYGDVLKDMYLIQRSRERRIAFGLSRSPGLLARAQAVASLDERDELQAVAAEAARVGGDGERATRGTAFHKLSEREDAGENLAYLPADVRAGLAAWRGMASRFDTLATETFVVNDELRAAGTFDRLWCPRGWMTAPDGTRVGPDDVLGVDLKSGASAKYFDAVYQVQARVYFGSGSSPYTHEAGRVAWPDGRAPRSDWALLPHVPLESPSDARLYWVSLVEGARMAVKADELRAIQRQKGYPAAELPTSGGPRQIEVVALIRAAGSRAELERLYAEHEAAWTPFMTAVAKRRLVELGVAS